jgi:hypothetical protein
LRCIRLSEKVYQQSDVFHLPLEIFSETIFCSDKYLASCVQEASINVWRSSYKVCLFVFIDFIDNSNGQSSVTVIYTTFHGNPCSSVGQTYAVCLKGRVFQCFTADAIIIIGLQVLKMVCRVRSSE